LEIPAQLILLSVPSIIYVFLKMRRGKEWSHIREELGLTRGDPIYYVRALGVAFVTGVLMLGVMRMVPENVLESPMVSTSLYAGMSPSFSSFIGAWIREGFYVALGEEVFFRGLLGGWLERRYGFNSGNLIQSIVFLLPHLLLLLVSTSFWVVIFVQFLAGWALGWLRLRSDSIFPGWLAHSLMNAIGAYAAMS